MAAVVIPIILADELILALGGTSILAALWKLADLYI